jgi:hypothetical protein
MQAIHAGLFGVLGAVIGSIASKFCCQAAFPALVQVADCHDYGQEYANMSPEAIMARSANAQWSGSPTSIMQESYHADDLEAYGHANSSNETVALHIGAANGVVLATSPGYASRALSPSRPRRRSQRDENADEQRSQRKRGGGGGNATYLVGRDGIARDI